MKYIIYILGICVITLSCAKDKLFGDKEILIGTWNWTQTHHIYDICEGFTSSEILTPETEGISFSMEFFVNGIVKFYQNNKLLSKKRIVFSTFNDDCGSSYEDYKSFDIRLNNGTDQSDDFSGCVSETDLIVSRGFPFDVYEKGCEFYTSYYTKQ